jgi:hypothetical protein
MPLQATSGAASYDAFGGGAAAVPTFVEDVFSTFLYNGTSTTNPINNGIDLSTKGGLVWGKRRNLGNSHFLIDTARGASNRLESDGTGAQADSSAQFPSFNSNGFTVATADNEYNNSAGTYVSWTFRKQPKFFDCGTFTAGGSTNRRISHALGSAPAFIIIKNISQAGAWYCYHRSLGRSSYLELQSTNAQDTGISNVWGTSDPTTTDFGVKETAFFADGDTVVYYVFAHDAGGFGLTGTDNVISCGSYTGNGSATGPEINLGYEPQWLLIKQSSGVNDWNIWDTMRGIATGGADQRLEPNTSDAEASIDLLSVNATGFQPTSTGSFVNASGSTYIYIAIRRGLMKVPTSGTSVFSPNAYTGAGAGTNYTTNFPVDSTWVGKRNDTASHEVWDRLRGPRPYLFTDSTAAEGTAFSTNQWLVDSNTKVTWSAGDAFSNTSPDTFVTWNFKRAPSFFDVCCYTGTGANRTVTHNLGVAPELMITKSRSNTYDWAVYAAGIGNTSYGLLNDAGQFYVDSSAWNDTSPTSSVFTVGTGTYMNGSGATYVAYLFATCAGVSKVGSYTGTATTKQIDCGFTGGARFVMIKRTDSTGDWYVWDTARGIVSGNDPYLRLNLTNAEVTNTDYIDTYSAGFEISSTAPAAINASGGTFIFLAIA